MKTYGRTNRTPTEACILADALVGDKRITYRLGKGGRDWAAAPWGELDCSGFVAWCLGYDRFSGREWWNTDAIVQAARYGSEQWLMASPVAPGDLVVFPGVDVDGDGRRDRIGHIGIVTAIDPTVPLFKGLTVVHCRGPGGRNPGVVRTSGALWNNRENFRGVINPKWKSLIVRYAYYR